MSGVIRREYETKLRDDPAEAGRARKRTRERLRRWGLDDLIETAELLVSELVTNAVVHGTAPAMLRLALSGVLRLEVADASPCPPAPRTAGLEDLCGRGLELVGLLSDQWGWQPTPGGKLVWAQLRLPGDDTPPGAPVRHQPGNDPYGDGAGAAAHPGDGAALVRPGGTPGLSGAGLLTQLARHILANPN